MPDIFQVIVNKYSTRSRHNSTIMSIESEFDLLMISVVQVSKRNIKQYTYYGQKGFD